MNGKTPRGWTIYYNVSKKKNGPIEIYSEIFPFDYKLKKK